MAKVWPFFADKALAIMHQGGDPHEIDEEMSRDIGRPITLFECLKSLTPYLAAEAAKHDERFRQEKLSDFVGAVHRWVCGYHSLADYIRADTALDIAKVELIRLQTSPRRPQTPSSSNDPRDQFIYDEYKNGTILKNIQTAVNETKDWAPLDSETAVLNALHRYCKRNKIDILTRKQKRNKRD
jgi:hypothetical protein